MGEPEKQSIPIAYSSTRRTPRLRRPCVATASAESATFLQQGVDLIEKFPTPDKKGFKSTVGHRFCGDLDSAPNGSRRQFHYYPVTRQVPLIGPVTLADSALPLFSDSRAFIGEFGIQDPVDGHGGLWPELNGADAPDTRTRTLERLKFIQGLEYPFALVWPDGLDGHGSVSVAPGPDPLL